MSEKNENTKNGQNGQTKQLAFVKVLQGNLVRDPVPVKNGALFTVANHNGGTEPNYVPISTWGALADEVTENLAKGSLVEVSGSLRSRQAKSKNGDVYTEVSVRATKVTRVEFDEENRPIKTPLHEAYNE